MGSPADAPRGSGAWRLRHRFSRGRLIAGAALVAAAVIGASELARGALQPADLPAFGTARAVFVAVAVGVWVLYDMSWERLREAERALLESQAAVTRFRMMVDNLRDTAIVLVDTRGRIASWNEGARALLGYEAPEILGREMSAIYTEDDREAGKAKRELRAAMGEGRFEDEGWRVRKDGSRFWANVIASAVRDEQGHVVGYVKLIRDLSERKRAEEERVASLEQMQELERLREVDRFKTQFINMAAHELNTPLTPIKLQIDLMRTQLREGQAPPAKTVEILDRNVERLALLVQDLLQVARLQAGRLGLQRQPVDLNRTVMEAAESFMEPARRAGLELETRLTPDLSLEADPKRLTQVLFNLLSNAIKFTPRGGRVVVETARRRGGAEVRVTDTGVGLRPEDMAKLFLPFSQVHDPAQRTRPGTGLGLYITKGLVELHGGEIRAQSDGPGRGSTFVVTLPFEAPAAPPREAPEAAPAAEQEPAALSSAAGDLERRANDLV